MEIASRVPEFLGYIETARVKFHLHQYRLFFAELKNALCFRW